jgi:hypothetical protein
MLQLKNVGVIAQDIIAAFTEAGLDRKEWNVVSYSDTCGVSYQRRPFVKSEALIEAIK